MGSNVHSPVSSVTSLDFYAKASAALAGIAVTLDDNDGKGVSLTFDLTTSWQQFSLPVAASASMFAQPPNPNLFPHGQFSHIYMQNGRDGPADVFFDAFQFTFAPLDPCYPFNTEVTGLAGPSPTPLVPTPTSSSSTSPPPAPTPAQQSPTPSSTSPSSATPSSTSSQSPPSPSSPAPPIPTPVGGSPPSPSSVTTPPSPSRLPCRHHLSHAR